MRYNIIQMQKIIMLIIKRIYLQLYFLIMLNMDDDEINLKLIQTEIKKFVTLCSFFQIK